MVPSGVQFQFMFSFVESSTSVYCIAALKFCFKTCVAMKFVDDDDDDVVITSPTVNLFK